MFFSILEQSSDTALGMASFMNINPAGGSIEVGHHPGTQLAGVAQGPPRLHGKVTIHQQDTIPTEQTEIKFEGSTLVRTPIRHHEATLPRVPIHQNHRHARSVARSNT